MATDTQYFAAQDADELSARLTEEREQYRNYITQNGTISRWRRSHELYFGDHFPKLGSQNFGVIKTGSQGELSAFSVNHYRNLIKHTLSMTTSQKPAFDCRSVNTDNSSIQRTKLGNKLLEVYMRHKRAGQYFEGAGAQSQVYGKAFVFLMWDPSLGRQISAVPVMDDDTGEPVLDENGEQVLKVIYEGDVSIETPMPEDVVTDSLAKDWNQVQWADVRLYRNKFDLAKQYPKQAEKILRLENTQQFGDFRRARYRSSSVSGLVPVHYFIHKKTRSMPNGRLTIRGDGELVLFDGPFPYEDKWPLLRIVPGEIFSTTEGYSDAFDLIGIQEAMNTLFSTAYSNQMAHGLQKVWMPDGGTLSATQLGKGLAVLRSPPGTKPEPLQLTSTAKEIFTMIPMLQKNAETIFGVNAVSRGDPDHGLDSGVALGLVQAMAVQYASAFQQSWAELLEDGASMILYLLQRFVTNERKEALTGKKSKSAMISYSGKDLEGIDTVIVDLGNAMSKTAAGRIQLADKFLEKGLVKTPQEYITVFETGNYEPVTEGLDGQLALIRAENEALCEGRPVKAIPGEPHLLHCQEHQQILSNIEVKMNDPITKMVLDHIQEHKNIYQTQDPFFSQIAGEPPAPQPMPPQGSPPPMGPPQGLQPGPGPEPKKPQPDSAIVEPPQAGEKPKLPLPKTANLPNVGGM